jgi:hypothetical protein
MWTLTRFIWRGYRLVEECEGYYDTREMAESGVPFLHDERDESVYLYQPDGLRVGYFPKNRPFEDLSAQGFYSEWWPRPFDV